MKSRLSKTKDVGKLMNVLAAMSSNEGVTNTKLIANHIVELKEFEQTASKITDALGDIIKNKP